MKKPRWRKCCPVCGRWILNPHNFIYSYRLEPDGQYRRVELCRACRDKELNHAHAHA